MKKRVGLLLIAITICFFSLGCNKTATIDNHIFDTDYWIMLCCRKEEAGEPPETEWSI